MEKQETFIQKSFEKALSIIPAYIEYAVRYSDPAWDDGVGIHLGRMFDNYLLPAMQEAGYEEREIGVFKTAFLDEIKKRRGSGADCDSRMGWGFAQ